MLREIRPALFHFDEDDRLPHVACEAGAAAVLPRLADAAFRLAAHVERTRMPERLEQPVEKDLRLSFFVAGDVGGRPRDKGG